MTPVDANDGVIAIGFGPAAAVGIGIGGAGLQPVPFGGEALRAGGGCSRAPRWLAGGAVACAGGQCGSDTTVGVAPRSATRNGANEKNLGQRGPGLSPPIGLSRAVAQLALSVQSE